ncbi:MAG: serine hydrolase domain-containing protein [Gaiellales bacterium]
MTEARLEHLVRSHQAANRVPSISVAIARDGGDPWELAVGIADAASAEPATPRHRYRIGSITKTFTATAVMQLVDDGLVGLDDPLSQHLPEYRDAAVTLRRMLAHISGLQREGLGDFWETLAMPTTEEIVASLGQVEQVLSPGERWHYSNLAFSLLGEVVARRRQMPYRQVVEERLLGPAGLTETAFDSAPPVARGYFVQPYTDEVTPQADPPLRGFDAAGGLMGTAADMCRWGHALAGPGAGLVTQASLDRMHLVHSMFDPERWTIGWGLGLELHRLGERLLAGHSGGMPGYSTGLLWSRSDRLVCAVMLSSGATGDPMGLAHELIEAELAERPAKPEEWLPGETCPPELESVLGHWWSEGFEFVFGWRKGHLEARSARAPAHQPPAVFEQITSEEFRVTSGREHGERLNLQRDASGVVTRMRWAGYPVTREPDPPTGETE